MLHENSKLEFLPEEHPLAATQSANRLLADVMEDDAYKKGIPHKTSGDDTTMIERFPEIVLERKQGFSRERLERLSGQSAENEYFREMVSRFSELDKDRSGRLTAEEIQPVLQNTGENVLRSLGEGLATPDEYLQAAARFHDTVTELAFALEPQAQVVSEMFSDLRRCFNDELEHDDQELTKPTSIDYVEELARARFEEIDWTLIEQGLDKVDILKQGELSAFMSDQRNYKQFTEWLTQSEQFETYDADEDGKLSNAELSAALDDYTGATVLGPTE